MAPRSPQASDSAHPSDDEAAGVIGRVLLVDDQPELRRLIRRSLHRAGYLVVEAWNGRVAIELAQRGEFDVVISDVRMPDVSGIELLSTLRDLDPDLPVVLTSGSPDPLTSLESSDLGAFAYLVKPVSFDTMRDTARRAVELRRARVAAKQPFEPLASVERLRISPPSDEDDES
jgi:two-component system, chemotaxis family, chemotaxis protein CheY